MAKKYGRSSKWLYEEREVNGQDKRNVEVVSKAQDRNLNRSGHLLLLFVNGLKLGRYEIKSVVPFKISGKSILTQSNSL